MAWRNSTRFHQKNLLILQIRCKLKHHVTNFFSSLEPSVVTLEPSVVTLEMSLCSPHVHNCLSSWGYLMATLRQHTSFEHQQKTALKPSHLLCLFHPHAPKPNCLFVPKINGCLAYNKLEGHQYNSRSMGKDSVLTNTSIQCHEDLGHSMVMSSFFFHLQFSTKMDGWMDRWMDGWGSFISFSHEFCWRLTGLGMARSRVQIRHLPWLGHR